MRTPAQERVHNVASMRQIEAGGGKRAAEASVVTAC